MERSDREIIRRLDEKFDLLAESFKRVLESTNTFTHRETTRMSKLMDEVDAMRADIARQTTVANGMTVFMKELTDHMAELEAKGTEEITAEDIKAMREKINENSDVFTAAMVKRTVAAEEPPMPVISPEVQEAPKVEEPVAPDGSADSVEVPVEPAPAEEPTE
jgi:DNA-binding transcriptional regulator YiaG